MQSKKQLVERYRLEKGLSKSSKIDTFEFNSWLNRFNRYNICFGRIAKKHELLTTEDMIEICSSLDYCVLKKTILQNDKKMVLCRYGFEPTRNRLVNDEGYLIANGYYGNIRPILLNNPERSFSVGIIAQNNQYNQNIVEYYRNLREELIKLGTSDITELSASDNDDIVYMISHVEPGKQIIKSINKPIYQYVSQR